MELSRAGEPQHLWPPFRRWPGTAATVVGTMLGCRRNSLLPLGIRTRARTAISATGTEAPGPNTGRPPRPQADTPEAHRPESNSCGHRSACSVRTSRMIWLPVLSGVASALVFLAISGVVAVPLWRAHGPSPWAVLYLFPGIMASTFVGVYFNVALAFAANEQIEGRMISVRDALGMAWSRRRVVFSWALLSAVVGTDYPGDRESPRCVRAAAGILGGLAWAVASFLVVPVLAFEDVGPIEALKQSSHLIKTTFGTIARGALRFGVLFLGWILLALAVIVAGVARSAVRHRRCSGCPSPSRSDRLLRRLHVSGGRGHVHAHDPVPLRHTQAVARPWSGPFPHIPALSCESSRAHPPGIARVHATFASAEGHEALIRALCNKR